MTDAQKPWEQKYGSGAADDSAAPWKQDYGPDADKAPSGDGNFARGFKTAMRQVPQTFGGAAALVGDAVGAKGLRDWGMDVYKGQEDKIKEMSRDSDSFTNVLKGDASLGDWAGYGAGYVGGQALQSLATGGVGGFVGKKIAEVGARKVIEEGIKRGAEKEAQELAKKQVRKGIERGAGAGLYGSNLMQEAGSIYPEAIEQAKQDGRIQEDGGLSGGDLARAGLSAVGAAALDTLMEAKIAKGILGGGAAQDASVVKRVLKEGAKGAGREALTEGMQTGMERWGAQQSLGDKEAIQDYIDSAALGALGGGMGGAPAGLRARGFQPGGGSDVQAGQDAQAAAAAATGAAADGFTTSLGAADTTQPAPTGVASDANRPDVEGFDPGTSPGAGVDRDGVPFVLDVDTHGLSLQDPAEVERARAASIDYEPVDPTPQWGTTPGAQGSRAAGVDMPAPQFDTAGLSLQDRDQQGGAETPPPSAQMGLSHSQDAGTMENAAALAVDSGASSIAQTVAVGSDTTSQPKEQTSGTQAQETQQAGAGQPQAGAAQAAQRTAAAEPAAVGAGQEGGVGVSPSQTAQPSGNQPPFQMEDGASASLPPSQTEPVASEAEAKQPSPDTEPRLTARQAQQAGAMRRANEAADARRAARQASADTGLRVGVTPGSADPVTVRDGTVYIGKYEALDYNSGEPVKAPEGSTRAAVAQALKDAGALTNRQKVFGLGEQAGEQVAAQPEAAKQPDELPQARPYPALSPQEQQAFDQRQGVQPSARAQVAQESEQQSQTVAVKDIQGNTHHVLKSELENGDKQKLRTFTADGTPKGALIHRDNLDAAGEKRAEQAKENARNPLFSTVTRKEGQPFASEIAARRELNRLGFDQTHEVVQVGENQFVGRRKKSESNQVPAPDSQAQAAIETKAQRKPRGILAKKAEADAARAAQQPMHQDPGQSAEVATQPVVAESVQKAARSEGTKPSEMRKWLLGEIDKELLQAPDRADYDEAVKRWGEKDAISAYTGNGPLGKGTETGFVTFDVPGDGKFKVRNSVRGLLEFRRKVSSSGGFKNTQSAPRQENDGVQRGSSSQAVALNEMVNDGDFEAARDYAQAVGLPLDAAKPLADRREQWKAFIEDGTLPAEIRLAETLRQADAEKETGPFGPIFSGFTNDPEGAISKLMQEKRGEVADAFTHPELGPIAFVYGDEKMGLRHIEVKHGIDQLNDVPRLLRTGRVEKDPEGLKRTWIVDDSNPANVAVLRLDWDGQEKTWLVSAYPADYGRFSQEDGDTRRQPEANRGADIAGSRVPEPTGRADATSTDDAAQPATPAQVQAATEQIKNLIGAAIDAMPAGEVNRIAKKFLPTMGLKPTMSKAKNKEAFVDPKVNLLGAAAELGVEVPAGVRRALDADMEGAVAAPDAEQGATANPFQKYDDEARTYGFEVRPDGAIGRDGKFPGAKVVEKGGRLRIESGSGNLLFSGAQTKESFGKFLEKFWYAEKLPQQQADAGAALNDRDHFTLDRMNDGSGKFEPVTFKRGEKIKIATGQRPFITGVITGISHNERQFKVDGQEHGMDFGYAYKADYDEMAKPKAKVDASLDSLERRLEQENVIDADRFVRSARETIERNNLGDYAKDRIAELTKRTAEISQSVVDKRRAAQAEKEAREARDREQKEASRQPLGAIDMTMEEWKAIHKDFKAIVDGQRMVLREGGMRKVNIVKAADQGGSKTPTVDQYEATMAAVREGKATPEQFKASFEGVVQNAEAIKAELATKTKAQLLADGGPYLQMRYRNEAKDDVVRGLYQQMVGEYALGEAFSYGMAKDSYVNAIRRLVEATDNERLQRFAQERKQALAEIKAKREARLQALENPKTLDDYRAFMRHWIERGDDRDAAFLRLSPEQRQQFDALEAESTREAREQAKARARQQDVKSAGNTTAGEVIATKHTKLGHDLFVVQLAERVSREDYETLNGSAKRLGGSYSSYRGNGAVPGFQFRTRDAAEAFRKLVAGDTGDAQAVAQQRRDAFDDDKGQSAAERLNTMADALDERADEELNRERKVNTARRARMASGAEAAARAQKALAGTMRNLAKAIEAGKAKFLDAVRQKAQVEYLLGVLRTAKSDQIRAKYKDYGEQQKRAGEPVDGETVDFARWPTATMFRSDLAGLARRLLEVDGGKKLGQQLAKVADDVTDAYLSWAKENMVAASHFGRRDGQMADFASRDEAERAIKRSGLTGKAIVLPIKRGENRVILSPSEAMQRGLWQGDGDKRISLSMDFVGELVALGKRKGDRTLSIPWQLEGAYEARQRLGRMGITTPAEFRSALRELAGLQEEMQTPDRIKEMERAMVGRRNDGLDFFPTPQAVVQQMLEAAEIQEGMAVLEPSAGMGHIADAIVAESGVWPDVVEMSSERRELLEAKGHNLAEKDDFTQIKPRESFTYGDTFRAPDGKVGLMRGQGGMGSQRVRLEDAEGNTLGLYDRDQLEGVAHNGTDGDYDRIVMNPPFSNGRDIDHVMHAYDLLKPGGRIVAIMSEGAFFNSNKKAEAFRAWLEERGATSEKLPEGSFTDPALPVNTGVNARMVVIDKPAESQAGDTANFAPSAAERPGSAQDKAVMRAIADGKSARDVLRLIASSSKNPFNRQVARLLLKAGVTPDIVFGHIGKRGADGIHGQYRGKTDTIHIAGSAEYAAERIFLHEAMHAATMRALRKKGLHSIQLRKLFEHVSKQKSLAGFYGIKNVDEFVAEVFTNPDFQRALKGIDAPSGSVLKTAWDSFVRILRSILGLGNDTHSALSQALNLGVGVVREDMLIRRRGGRADGVANMTEKLRGLARMARAPGNANETVTLGPLSARELALLRREGVPVEDGFSHTIDMFAVRHAINRHGDEKAEARIGQLPVSDADVAAAAQILNEQDAFILGAKTPRGQDIVGSLKRMPDGTVLYLEEVRSGRKTLAMTSMRKYPGTTDFETIRNRIVPSYARSDTGDVRIVYPDDTGSQDIANFGTDEVARNIGDGLKSITVPNVKRLGKHKLTDWLKMGLQFLGRRQLVDIYGDMLPMAEYDRLAAQMEADKNESGAEADELVRRWAKLPDDGKLADLMHEATLAQIDADSAVAHDPGDDQMQSRALKGRFDALSPEAQKVYREARDSYRAHHAQVRQAIKDRIERSELSSSKRAELLKRMDDDFFQKVKGVYFPLARFGQYVVAVKDADGQVVSVSRAETMPEAERARAQLLGAFPKEKGFSVGRVTLDKEFVASHKMVGRGFMTDLYRAMEGIDLPTDQLAELEDTLGQLYLSSLPDLSWAKHGIHRKGTPGFSQDARRAFAQNTFHGARYLAKLRYGDRMQTELEAMQKHVDEWSAVEDFDQPGAQRVVDEMMKRHDTMMNPKSNPLATAMTSLGFVYYLGLSPAAAVVNLSQTGLVAYPVMAAKWGYAKTASALLKASEESVRGKNDIRTQLKSQDEMDAYDRAVASGVIDVTQAHDLAGVAQGEDQRVAWKLRPVMRVASFLFHHAERFNRQATFMAAYRLAKEAGSKNAYEDAVKATYDGHFDYSSSNRPRVMQGNVARVVLLFKQFAQNMIYTIGRQAYLSVQGESPEVRKQARKTFAGLMVTHAMGAGVLGLPLVAPLLAVASALGGDDDEPWDAEAALRNMLADTFGPKASEVIAKGLSRLTPWDISGRVGLDDLIFPDVQEGIEGQRWAESFATGMLGPVISMGVNAAKAAQSLGDGNYQRALEDFMPVAPRNAVKAYRYWSEGDKDKTGVVVKDEVGLAGVLGQVAGFSPSEVRLAREGRSAVLDQDRRLGERRSELLAQYAHAAMRGDAEGKQKAADAIRAFNEKNPTRRITVPQMMQSVRNRQRRIDQAQDGVYLPRTRRDAAQAGAFALDGA